MSTVTLSTCLLFPGSLNGLISWSLLNSFSAWQPKLFLFLGGGGRGTFLRHAGVLGAGSDLCHSSDNAGCWTARSPEDSPKEFLKKKLNKIFSFTCLKSFKTLMYLEQNVDSLRWGPTEMATKEIPELHSSHGHIQCATIQSISLWKKSRNYLSDFSTPWVDEKILTFWWVEMIETPPHHSSPLPCPALAEHYTIGRNSQLPIPPWGAQGLDPINVYIFWLFFRATPEAYGGSQARGQIGATAASLHHSYSNARSKLFLWPIPQLIATPILNPLSEARDWTLSLMDTSRICFHCTTRGTPEPHF